MLTEKLETEAKDIFSSDLEDKESIDSDKYHNDPTYFPDGGLRAWLQVVGGFCSLCDVGFSYFIWCLPKLLQTRASARCLSFQNGLDQFHSVCFLAPRWHSFR